MNLKDCKTKEEVFDSLREYLEDQIKLFRRETESDESFNKPAWAEFQAHKLGSIKAYMKLYKQIPDQGKK